MYNSFATYQTRGRGEMVDAIGLGPIARKGLGVRVLSSAPEGHIDKQ